MSLTAIMMLHLFRNSLLVLTLLWGAAAIEKGSTSFLRKMSDGGMGMGTGRILDGASNEVCPPADEQLFYNSFFSLCDEEGFATEECTDEDEERFGTAISNIVALVDLEFPMYRDSLLNEVNTTVCVFPSFTMEGPELEDEHRELADNNQRRTRRKRTCKSILNCCSCAEVSSLLSSLTSDMLVFVLLLIDTHSAGGRCRRCKQNNRFLLDKASFEHCFLGEDEVTKEDKDLAKQTAKEVCDLASVSKMAMSIGQKALDSIMNYIDDMKDRAASLEDQVKVTGGIEDVERQAADVIELLEDASDEDKDADDACLGAQDYVRNGEVKQVEKCLKTAKKASEKVKSYIEDIHGIHEMARDDTKKAIELIVAGSKEERKGRCTQRNRAGERG